MWLASRRSKRLEQFPEAERHEWMNIIERRHDEWQQKEREMDRASTVKDASRATGC